MFAKSVACDWRNSMNPDYVKMCQCLIFLDEPLFVANVLKKLSAGSQADALMAYQIAFDIFESATQQFLSRVLGAIRKTAAASVTSRDDIKESMNNMEEKLEVKEEPNKVVDKLAGADIEMQNRFEKLARILSGEEPIHQNLQFLIKNDHSDPLILKQTKDNVCVSICNQAIVTANGLMHSGTTHDQFLRDNLDWLSRTTNWSKLSAVASLGVIHRGHEKESMRLMKHYLPKDCSGTKSGFVEGGGLYALGLIHANHDGDITEYLLGQVKDAGSQQIKHGGCLGLGLTAMGTHRADVYEQLKCCLFQDNAGTGDSAGLAMGLCHLGSKSATAIEVMVTFAQNTRHKKILRGLAVGIALIMYGRLLEADPLIESLTRDKNAILRRSGMYTIAMAYCGTGDNSAITKLLHAVGDDVDDDVRGAAVMSLGKPYILESYYV